MNQATLIELLIAALPYPEQIKNIDLEQKTQVRFDWRGNRYRVTTDLGVDEVHGRTLHGTDGAMLMRELLRRTRETAEAKTP